MSKCDTCKINKSDIVSEIAGKTGLTKTDSEKAINAFVAFIEESLKARKEVRLLGFGTFYVSKRNATVARNPRTGEEVKVPETYLPKFKPGKQLKEAI